LEVREERPSEIKHSSAPKGPLICWGDRHIFTSSNHTVAGVLREPEDVAEEKDV